MEEDNKSDNAFEPGAATFGNFINYYTFNPPEQRISLFQKDFCDFLLKNRSSSATPTVLTDTPILCSLDIGCNSGVSLFIPHPVSFHSLFTLFSLAV